jgi:P27 family predicted phage terminase small subunit
MSRGGRHKHLDLIALEGGRSAKGVEPVRPEPITNKSKFPVPRLLPKAAKNFVKKYKQPLIQNNVLRTLDWTSFLTMAILSAEIEEHVKALSKEGYLIQGRQGKVKNTRTSLLRSAEREFRLYANEFGLTPKGRNGLDIKIIDSDKKDSVIASLIDW